MAHASKKNQDILSSVTNGSMNKDIKNLSSIIKLAKSKKSTLSKTNFFGTDFLTFGAKKPLYTYEKLLLRLQFLSILI